MLTLDATRDDYVLNEENYTEYTEATEAVFAAYGNLVSSGQ